MITTYKVDNTKIKPKDDYISVDLRGKSTDTKPTEVNGKKVDNGSQFIEMDTGKIYFYDLENKQWLEF